MWESVPKKEYGLPRLLLQARNDSSIFIIKPR